MDAVEKTLGFLSSWGKSGEADCRKYLVQLHSTPADSNAVDALVATYHTLLSSTLSLWPPKHPLTPAVFAAFVKGMLLGLPSSHDAPSPAANALGELLIDAMWSIDSQLDDILTDPKATVSAPSEKGNQKEQADKVEGSGAVLNRDTATKDKVTLLEIMKLLLKDGVLNPGLCRERLDMSLVAGVGLVLDRPSFDKKEVRVRTGLFYKQNKFNLLREQSEGYSKLFTEVTSALPAPHSPATGLPLEPLSVSPERVQAIWKRIVSLIGYFDLDPNRALDVILDLFSAYITTHWSFFLVLLSLSPWTGQCGNLAWINEEKSEPIKVEPGSSRFRGKSLDEILSMAGDTDLSKAPPVQSTPRVMAQVLGFKFRHYQSPEITEATPRQLYLTAALLIREDFITLDDLYPHLTPTDDDLETKGYKAYLATIDARIDNAKVSQLALAAPLESSSQPSSSRLVPPPPPEVKKPPTSTEPRDPPNQKVGLVVALLSVGALRPALALLTKFSWLVDAYPEIADLLIRVMKHSLTSLYDQHLVTKPRNPSNIQPRARWGATGVVPAPARKPMLTLCAPTPPGTSTIDFVYFFPFWTDRVPLCNTMDDLIDVIEPLMAFVGLHVSRDPVFLTKFARLGRLHIASTLETDPSTKKPVGSPDSEHPIPKFWHKILRVYFLPALPLIRGNAVCTVEIWNVIRQFETTVRWKLYGEWKTRTYTTHPELRLRAVQVDRESKGVLRRLSHNTIDTLSGTVAKIAHSNPCIFFANAVNQIMAYDNLASVVVQALRYATNMGFDVLVYIILDALANPHKDRVKDDGVNTSDWLQSLASFTGMLFRRYSADLSPLLKYIVHQLYAGQTTEIVVLRELIWKMAGIEPLPSLSETQIAAMAGGPTLRIEAVASSARGARLDPGDAVLKGPQRLGKALLDSQLALPLLVQVAQQRQSAVYKIPDAHLKSLAGLYDATHGVLLQYLELLTSPAVIQPQDYAQKVVPTLAELGEKYGICPSICMQIIRPILHSSLLAAALAAEEQERVASEEAEKRLKAALAAKRDPSIANSRIASPAVGEVSLSETPASAESKSSSTQEARPSEDVVMENGDSQGNVNGSSALEVSAGHLNASRGVTSHVVVQGPWVPEMRALFEDVKKIAPKAAYDIIGPGFYLTFWQLSTYDLAPPASRYEEEGAALRALSRQEDSKYTMADRSSDRTKRQGAQAHRARRDRYAQFSQTLAQELKTQAASRRYTIKRLAKEKAHWFSHGPKAMALALASAIIEHCIQPRCLLSPMDADYCAQVIKAVHIMGTPGFSTLMVYDRLLGDHIKVVVFSCSEYEAKNYGTWIFSPRLCARLYCRRPIFARNTHDLYKWFSDEALYEQDNRTKAGGKIHYLPGFQQSWSPKFPVEKTSILAWNNFQQVLRKWHRKLFRSLADCIKTNEFMHVYNAIIVLKEILPVFPLSAVIDLTGPSLIQVIETFIEKEERGDLKILARALTPSTSRSHAQPLNGTERPSTPSSAKSVIDRFVDWSRYACLSSSNSLSSVPRPEVVRRVRTEPRGDTPGRSTVNGNDVDSNQARRGRRGWPSFINSRASHRCTISSLHKTVLLQSRESPTPLPTPAASSLPPTASAQELRETARQRIADELAWRIAKRSHPPTRPGTGTQARRVGRVAKDSWTVGGGPSDDRRLERESSRQDGYASERREHRVTALSVSASAAGIVTGTENAIETPRRARKRPGARQRETGRDRERDRERDRDRDRGERGDRHRRDEKDRDRESRKEREISGRTVLPAEERSQSARPGHRSAAPTDETLGKRRRPGDDDSDRTLKRSSREKNHHERTRESDRRRRDREEDANNDQPKHSEKRVLDGPTTTASPLPPTTPSAPRAMAISEPMRNGKPDAGVRERDREREREREQRERERDREWVPRESAQQHHHRDRERERESPTGLLCTLGTCRPVVRSAPPHATFNVPSVMNAPPPPCPPLLAETTGASLVSGSGRQAGGASSRESVGLIARLRPPQFVPLGDDWDGTRKRSLSDREKNAMEDASADLGSDSQVPKRPRIIRNRYVTPQTHGLAKKLLPIDPGANDKPRSGRKDYG
ncbi:transcription factor/nuclear export subunit protein 2-domain-containing protein [Lactarius deliciosus]|nr:transcription factor/nuclear export subunit protein 2-domain-containing protein [Lactarius deliciosus]